MTPTSATAGMVTVAIVLGILACGEDPQEPVPSFIRDLSPPLAENWDYAPEPQRALLSDGDLTFDEYESAVLASVQCLHDEGVQVDDPKLDETGWRLTYGIFGGPDTAAVDRTQAKVQRCFDEHQAYIEFVWIAMNEPTEAERQAAEAALRDCLLDRDPTSAELPPFGKPEFLPALDAAGLLRDFEECTAQVHAETGVLLGKE